MADTIQRAAARVIDAWDSTVLPVANDGRLQEAMEDLRAALAEQAAEQASAVQAVDALNTWRPVRLEFGVTMHRDHNPPSGGEWLKKDEVLAAVAGAAPAAEQAEPVAVPASIVAGAIFDFAGFLTTHKCVIKVGSTANASPVVERIKEWAGLRGLPIDDADVLSWQKNTAPPAPARQEWQPIETAPKTGAKIIVRYVNRNNKPRTVMARWLTDEQAEETDADGVGLKGGWYECIDNWDDYTEVAIHEGEPSLWMPLPAAPITAAPAEGGA